MLGADWRAMENSWRDRVQAASADYDQARFRCQQIEQDSLHGKDGHANLLATRQIEDSARERYRLALEIFTNLVLRSRMPPPE